MNTDTDIGLESGTRSPIQHTLVPLSLHDLKHPCLSSSLLARTCRLAVHAPYFALAVQGRSRQRREVHMFRLECCETEGIALVGFQPLGALWDAPGRVPGSEFGTPTGPLLGGACSKAPTEGGKTWY